MAGGTSAAQTGEALNLETSVCGLKEPIMFWLWSRQAGRPDGRRLAGLSDVEEISVVTKDNRILRGYLLRARDERGVVPAPDPRGYLLVVQGNAILADQILREFSRYADAGYDVYLYDYRGYGRSQGKRRLKAMVSDYQEIISRLNTAPYRERLVYAMSFGGIVLLDAWRPGFRLDRIVIDSSPSRLSDHGCPEEYDPVDHLPLDCGNFMVIVGGRDMVVPPAMSLEMAERARQRGALTVRDPDLGHPFMDRQWSLHQRRMDTIERFLLAR